MRKLITIMFIIIFGKCYSQTPIQMFWTFNRPISFSDSALFVNKVILNGGSLTSTERAAIGTLITQLKDSSLWASFTAIYPMVGGSDASCRVNLKSPSTFSISFFNSPSFSSNGVDWNGTNQYGNTTVTPSTSLSLNSTSISYYSRENTATPALDMGCNDALARTYFNPTSYYAINQTISTDSYVNPNTSGLFTISRTASNLVTEYRNGISTASTTSVSTALCTVPIFIGARNNTGGATGFTDRQCAFAAIGGGLTAGQSLTFYNIVQTFQTTLSRQV